MDAETPRSAATRTPGSRKPSAAPASRALVTGLSLAATCTIIAALALTAPVESPKNVQLDTAGGAGASGGVAPTAAGG